MHWSELPLPYNTVLTQAYCELESKKNRKGYWVLSNQTASSGSSHTRVCLVAVLATLFCLVRLWLGSRHHGQKCTTMKPKSESKSKMCNMQKYLYSLFTVWYSCTALYTCFCLFLKLNTIFCYTYASSHCLLSFVLSCVNYFIFWISLH